jgi:transposase-like protein
MQRWYCKGCRKNIDTHGGYPVAVISGCSGTKPTGGAHRWIKAITTDQPVHYICKYCGTSFNTSQKTYNELKPCSKNPTHRKYHVLIKR